MRRDSSPAIQLETRINSALLNKSFSHVILSTTCSNYACACDSCLLLARLGEGGWGVCWKLPTTCAVSLALTYDTLSTASDEKLGKGLGMRCFYCRCHFCLQKGWAFISMGRPILGRLRHAYPKHEHTVVGYLC